MSKRAGRCCTGKQPVEPAVVRRGTPAGDNVLIETLDRGVDSYHHGYLIGKSLYVARHGVESRFTPHAVPDEHQIIPVAEMLIDGVSDIISPGNYIHVAGITS